MERWGGNDWKRMAASFLPSIMTSRVALEHMKLLNNNSFSYLLSLLKFARSPRAAYLPWKLTWAIMCFTSNSTPPLISILCYVLLCVCVWVLVMHYVCRKSNCCFNSSSPAWNNAVSLLHGRLFTVQWLMARLPYMLCFDWESGVCWWWAVGLWGPVNWIKGQHLWGISQEPQLPQHVLLQVSRPHWSHSCRCS